MATSSRKQVISMNKYEEFAMMLSKCFTEYLSGQKNLSRNTISSYRNTFSLLLVFMNHMKSIPPEKMDLDPLFKFIHGPFPDVRHLLLHTSYSRITCGDVGAEVRKSS